MATQGRALRDGWRGWMARANRQLPSWVRGPAGVVGRTFQFYMADNCGIYAAAIAYYAIFSLVPLALVTLAIFGAFIDRAEIVDFVFDQFALQDTASVREDVDRVIGRAADFSLAGLSFGAIGLVWSGSGIFSALRRGLNTTTHLPGSRSFLEGKLIDLAMVPMVGILIVSSIALTTLARVAFDRAGDLGFAEFDTNLTFRLVSLLLPVLVTFPTFFLMYRWVPSHRVAGREALVSATFATVVFELFKNAVALVVSLTPYSQDQALYASIGTALAFLFVVFLAGSIILLGAEFGRAAMRPSSEAHADDTGNDVAATLKT